MDWWDVLALEQIQLADGKSVYEFADRMKEKMDKSTVKGRSGWREMHINDLWHLLREHVIKGDPVDIANLAMMIEWHTREKKST